MGKEGTSKSRGIRLPDKLWTALEEYRKEKGHKTVNEALDELLKKWLERRG